jgi:collagenase-like PrtC family protease
MAAELHGPRLVLGPVLFLWDTQEWRDFYFRIADEADVDCVVLGEVVCSKRLHFHDSLVDEVAVRLQAGGKAVRLASLALVTNEREVRATRTLCAREGFEIEAEDLSAHHLLGGRPHAIGPLVNVYNGAAARVLGARGARTICLPPELPLASVAAIVRDAPDIAFEVFAFGRVPLAISARCAHARVKGKTKDTCQFVCGDDPDGLPVDTLDGQHFLALNGVQTMSYTCQSFIADVPALLDAGVAGLRLSPQYCDMVGVADTFRRVATGRLDPRDGQAMLAALYEGASFSNGFLHGDAGHRLVLAAATAGLPD